MSREVKPYELFLDLQKDLPVIFKDAKNPHFNSEFASLPNVLKEVHSHLFKKGWVMIHVAENDKVSDGLFGLTTKIVHAETATEFSNTMYAKPARGLDPQSIGATQTYLMRYTIVGLFSLPIEKDDDGNSASLPGKQAPKEDDLIQQLFKLTDSKGWKREKISQILEKNGKASDPRDLTDEELKKFIQYLKGEK